MGFKAGDLDEGEAGGWSSCTTCVPISDVRWKESQTLHLALDTADFSRL